jgi:NAD(P)-dependent dehydrogenase (short-subunit alcohol dehydrogenase family)
MDLEGRTAVITGGASGIGRAMALALAQAGTHVVVADVEEDRAKEVAEEVAKENVRSLAVGTDVTSRDSVEALADAAYAEFGAVHLLCNNAGVGARGALDELPEENWHWVLSVNLTGVYHGVSVFVPRMKRQGAPAHILNTSSEHGIALPSGQMGVYTASKHAVVALSDVMRRDYAEAGIGVSVLCPGIVNTDIWNCARNRPERLGGAVALPEVVGEQWRQHGMDPMEVGRLVVRGLRRGDFYILTHPEVRSLVEARYRELLDAFDAAADPAEAR